MGAWVGGGGVGMGLELVSGFSWACKGMVL